MSIEPRKAMNFISQITDNWVNGVRQINDG